MPRSKIEKSTPEQLSKLGINSWSSWDCDPFGENPKSDPSTSWLDKLATSLGTRILNPNKEELF